MAGTVQSNTQFAVWLQKNHPTVFKKLLAQATAARAKKTQLSALYRGSYLGRLGRLGDISDYVSYVSSDSSNLDISLDPTDLSDATSAFDTSGISDAFSSGGADITSQSTDVDQGGTLFTGTADTPQAISDSISAETAVATNPDVISSDITQQETADLSAETNEGTPTANIPNVGTSTGNSSATGSSAKSPASTVGQFLTSAQGIQTVLAAAATVATANLASKVIGAQASRAAAGQAPANVSYATSTDPTTGIVTTTPVLNTATGTVPITTANVNGLLPSNVLSSPLIYVMLGALALVYLME